MPQEAQKSNTVLIIIAILGVFGTIIGATINVIGNYNVEKLRQETELTRIALISIVTQGGATQVSMASTLSAPTNTPQIYPDSNTIIAEPSQTDFLPTDSLIPSPIPRPTFTLTPMSIPDFYDSFDTGIRSEWEISSGRWGVINGQLTQLEPGGKIMIGDETWENYSVQVDVIHIDTTCDIIVASTTSSIRLRVQNDSYTVPIFWVDIPSGTIGDFALPYTVRVDLQGDLITTYINDNMYLQMNIPPYNRGKVGLSCENYKERNGSKFDNFNVSPLP